MMEYTLQDTIALLTRTPAVLDALLRDLPEAWILANEGSNTWNSFQIIGHLVHCERTDFMERTRIVLHSGESRTFDPLDRWGFVPEVEGRSLGELLNEFARLRTENLVALRALNLQQTDFERRGRHPALGAVTLAQLLATWATHDLSHVHQISRVLAHQYRQAVGPWSGHLGVLQCAGHSS